MRRPRIYTEQVLRSDATIQLESGPSQHIARALRMRIGDSLVLFDGRGGQYPATVTALAKRLVSATTGAFDPSELESGLQLHVGIAISRGERMDWIVQKATELGVSSIAPLFSRRTEVKLSGERAEKKLRHWQQVVIGACEQCGRNQLPRLQPLQPLDEWLHGARADIKLVLHHLAGRANEPVLTPASIALLIGPEGGLTPAEIQASEQAGFQPMRLGPRVLRTETAPLAAIAILQARWGDMSPS